MLHTQDMNQSYAFMLSEHECVYQPMPFLSKLARVNQQIRQQSPLFVAPPFSPEMLKSLTRQSEGQMCLKYVWTLEWSALLAKMSLSSPSVCFLASLYCWAILSLLPYLDLKMCPEAKQICSSFSSSLRPKSLWKPPVSQNTVKIGILR